MNGQKLPSLSLGGSGTQASAFSGTCPRVLPAGSPAPGLNGQF